MVKRISKSWLFSIEDENVFYMPAIMQYFRRCFLMIVCYCSQLVLKRKDFVFLKNELYYRHDIS